MAPVIQDMFFAAYLISQGKKITHIHRKARKVSWEFELSEEELSELEINWPSSPECRFSNAYQNLKGHLKLP